MTVNAYEMLFTDQNTNREFVIQPYTMNGPATPTTGVDPSAASANTTLFLYGKGAPNYGERIQENLVYMLEHFNNPTEPSFPIPGQIWCNSTTLPARLYVYSVNKYTVVSNSGNVIAIQSTNSLDSTATVLARFQGLGTTKSFTVYSPTLVPYTFTQQAVSGYPQVSGNMVLLNVSPAPPLSSMAGYTTGGWEDIFQGNQVNVLRTTFNANGNYIQNLPTPVLSGDAANKAYVDAATTGGTLVLSNLGDVLFQTPFNPQTNAVLYFNGTKWTDKLASSLPFLPTAGGTMSGAINMGGQQINNVGMAGVPASTDATNVAYVQATVIPNQITSPANNNLFVYNATLFKWINSTPTNAGILPLSGGTMTGVINMGGFGIQGLPALSTPYPVNPTDAATKAYVDSVVAGGSAGISGATYDSATGVLTITQVSSPTSISVSGFLPIAANEVDFVPSDPAIFATNAHSTFFQATLSTLALGAPNLFENPVSIDVNGALKAVDQNLSNYTVPRQRLVMVGNSVDTTFNFNTGTPNTLIGGQPGVQYVVGSGALSIYINGLKQIPSDNGFFKLTGINTTTTISGVSFTTSTSMLTILGGYLNVLRPGVHFTISGTSTANDGSYTVVSAVISGSNTVITTTPNLFSSTPGTSSFVASGTGTLTYGPFGIMPAMQTGFAYGGASNPLTLSVGVNGSIATTATIDTSTTNCTNFGLLANAVNAYAQAYYVNPIIGASFGAFGTFLVAGNRVSQFPTGTSFVVRYSSANSGTYTVNATPIYANGQTTIQVSGTIPSNTIDGVIFQDNWGYTLRIENGTLVFYSNVAGTGSSISLSGGTLLTTITGIDWPITISSLAGTSNAFAPATYAYSEIGAVGYLSSIVSFQTAPETTDTIEIVVDRDMVYGKNLFLTTATG